MEATVAQGTWQTAGLRWPEERGVAFHRRQHHAQLIENFWGWKIEPPVQRLASSVHDSAEWKILLKPSEDGADLGFSEFVRFNDKEAAVADARVAARIRTRFEDSRAGEVPGRFVLLEPVVNCAETISEAVVVRGGVENFPRDPEGVVQ